MRQWLLALVLVVTSVPAMSGYKEGVYYFRQREYKDAIKEFLADAEKGHPEAQYYLGNMYVRGLGMNQNDALAYKWFKASGDQGNAKSQYNLGLMYMEGRGIRKDNIQAYIWFSLTANSGDYEVGDKGAKSKEVVAKRLTKEQIDDADNVVKIWRPRKK
ncbi:MAG: sel1 repeat family protein [Alphaproteobacteria bacterium]|nr:sel1 repeat family protein [Alphaproteobacteria bacterium]